jgi:hypothetical protein
MNVSMGGKCTLSLFIEYTTHIIRSVLTREGMMRCFIVLILVFDCYLYAAKISHFIYSFLILCTAAAADVYSF